MIICQTMLRINVKYMCFDTLTASLTVGLTAHSLGKALPWKTYLYIYYLSLFSEFDTSWLYIVREIVCNNKSSI